jgi:hypothetical protein
LISEKQRCHDRLNNQKKVLKQIEQKANAKELRIRNYEHLAEVRHYEKEEN